MSKVPAVTLMFWIIKIAATTLGETGGDAVTMSMNLGYLVGTAIFATIFLIAVSVCLSSFMVCFRKGRIACLNFIGVSATSAKDMVQRSENEGVR